MSISQSNLPIKDEWVQREHGPGLVKEILGWKTPCQWHCRSMMRRIIQLCKTDEHGVKRRCVGWICEVCGKRVENPPWAADMMA